MRVALLGALAALAIVALAPALVAQAPVGATASAAAPVSLDQVDSLIAEGRTESARGALVAWLSVKTSRSRSDAQRALWQRAVLTVDPAQAAIDFQRLVVEYPGGPYSDRALLRLAQAADAQGDPARAQTLLTSLLRDYPSSPARLEAGVMMEALAHAPQRAPVPQPATVPPKAEVAATTPPERPAAKPEIAVPPPEKPAAKPEIAATAPAKPAPKPAAPAGRWAVQLGAFASPERAEGLKQDLAGVGVDARLVLVPGSRLIRVRTGRFGTQADADAARDRLAARGLPATVAGDADREEAAP